MESNPFIRNYLQMRDKLANNTEKEDKKDKKVKKEGTDVKKDKKEPEDLETFYSLQSIIEEKPEKSVVKEFLRKRKETLDEEYGN